MNKKFLATLIFIFMTVLSACSSDPVTLTIEFDTRGGLPIAPLQITEDDPFILPTPIREGYVFIGWRYQNQLLDDPNIQTFLDSNTFNIYLAAAWEQSVPDEISIRFVNAYGAAPETQWIMPGEAIELPVLRDTDTHTFSGWFLDEAGNLPFNNETLLEAITLYAKYEEVRPLDVIQINLTFNDEIRVNQTVRVNGVVLPTEAAITDYRLESSDPSVVEVLDDSTLFIHNLGTVTLTAIALDRDTRFETVLVVTRYGIKTQDDLNTYFEKDLNVDLELIQDLDNLTIAHPLKLNLNGFRIGTLKIESTRSGSVTLTNGTVQNALFIDAPNMRVLNGLTILGPTTLTQIGSTSFISNGRHHQPIVMEGPGRIELSGQASSVSLTITTASEVVLDGQMNGPVTISADDAKVQINGSIQRLNVEGSATITVRNNATIDALNAGSRPITLKLESTAHVNFSESDNITVERLQRVYVNGISAPSRGYYSISKGSRIDFIERTPTRAGHRFLGWFTDASFETAFNFNQVIDEDITLYAHWQINTYQVRFNGITPAIPAQTVNYGSRVPQPQAPQKEGYRFVGWFIDPALEIPAHSAPIVDKDMTIYARYDINTFNVSFQNATIQTQTVAFNQRPTRPLDPERTGHRFVGWFSDPSFQTPFDFSRPVTQSITVYARYEINTYLVFFSGVNLPSVEVNYNQTISRPANPVKEGHTFRGWFTDAAFEVPFNFSQPILASTTIYASFEANTFRVSFNPYTSAMNIPAQTIAYQARPILSIDLEREGYLFAGWYKDANFTERFSLSDRITEATTLHAKWLENEGNLNGVIHFINEDNDPLVMAQNTPINLPAPTRVGYRFLGWYEDSALATPLRAQLTETNLAVYARYEPITYSVRFEGVAMEIQTVRYNQRVSVPPAPRKEGYVFTGWYQDASFQTLFNFQQGITQNTVIYARFESLQLRVQFVGATIPQQLIAAQGLAVRPSDPQRVGHTFEGFYADDQRTQPFDFTRPIQTNTTIYVKWRIHQFNVQFNTDVPGLNFNPQTVDYGLRPVLPGSHLLIKEGHTFEGWYLNASKTQRFSGSAVITSDTTLYANWLETIKIFIHFNNIDRDSIEVTEGSFIDLPIPSIPVGFEFTGWYEDADFNVPLGTHAPDSALNVYARFSPIIYTVAFLPMGPDVSIDEMLVEHGQTLTLANPSTPGYDFDDWYLDANFTTPWDPNRLITESLTLYGKFNIHTFNIVFHPNVEGITIDAQVIEFNQKVPNPNTLLEEPLTWIGHLFKGWYLDSALTQLYDFDAPVSRDLNLYAKWDVILYPVRFNNQGFITTEWITHGSILSSPTAPERLGHTFAGWYLSDQWLGQEYIFNQSIQSAVTLYAKWDVNQYLVRYLEEDGITLIEERLVTYGAALVPPEVSLNLGQQLSGWALEDELISLSTYKMPAQGITLKAIIASTNALLITVEQYIKTASIVQVEIWLRGTVEINAYDILIEFNIDQLTYSNHLPSSYVQAINTANPGQIRLNYSNVNQALTDDTMVIRIEFNRVILGASSVDVQMVEGYFITNLREIIAVEAEPIPLTINE